MPPTIRRMFPWLLAFLFLLIAPFALATPSTPTEDFTDNGDGTVTHRITGLTWMRCAVGQTWDDSTCTGTGNRAFPATPNQTVTATFAGKSDWRLPSIAELNTIVERDNTQPTINNTIFPNTPISGFISGSPFTHNPVRDGAWLVDFRYGHTTYYFGSCCWYARLVRGGDSLSTLRQLTHLPRIFLTTVTARSHTTKLV